MSAGRLVSTMGMAVAISTACAIGLIAGPQSSPSSRASVSQNTQPQVLLKPVVYRSLKNDASPRLDGMHPVEPVAQDLNRIRINKVLPARAQMASRGKSLWPDFAVQAGHGASPMPMTIANFDGVNNVNNVIPPDPQGAVGPDHYVQWVNLSFAVYTKTGVKVYPSGSGYAAGNTLWQGFGGACETANDGDPITLYDRQAGRWLMAQFALPNYPSGPYYECIAVSQTGDPTGSWYRYVWQSPSNKVNDYPKFGVWPDGYYMSINQFAGSSLTWAGAGVVAFERDKMVAGLAAQAVYFDLFALDPNFGGMLPSDLDGAKPPTPGSPNYFVEADHGFTSNPDDLLQIFKFHADWSNTSSSTFTGPVVIDLTSLGYPFDSNMCGGSVNCIPQKGTAQKLDAISDRLMYRLAYRNFGDHESLVLNHTVDADGTDHAGIRWYELRNLSTTPTVFQAGTYAPDADHRWMGSIAMDAGGNIALGFSVSSSATYPSIRYVGRLVGDPLGTLPQTEVTLMAGSGSQTHAAARWGDYSMMAIDPADDCTFWYTQEYFKTTSSSSWWTRIGSFRFPSCTSGPAGAVAGTVTVSGAGTPLAGVNVQLGVARGTQTLADGTYQFTSVPVGTYDVTFSKDGYIWYTAAGVTVNDGLTTTLNAALVIASPATISGVVKDGSGHNWPLYARIDVAGFPSKTTYTNPATGTYSIGVWSGLSYSLTATSVAPGYQAGSAVVTPAGTPPVATSDFNLAVDASCSAPGYAFAAQAVAHSADFGYSDGGYVGAGVNSSWAWGSALIGLMTPQVGGMIWRTNLSGNYNASEDSTLTSPVIDLSGHAGQGPTLTWEQALETQSNQDVARVDVTKDGVSWTTVYGPVSGPIDLTWNPHRVPLDSSYATSAFQVRFHLTSDGAVQLRGWQLRGVAVLFGGCTPVPGGMLEGVVTDALTSSPLVGATVTSVQRPSDQATTVATPADPNLPDGFYQLFSSMTGSVAFDVAHSAGYATMRGIVPVVADKVVAQSFQLSLAAPDAPTGLTASVVGSTLSLAWTAPAGGVVPTSYTIEAGSGSGLTDLVNFSTGTVLTTYSVSNVTNGYYYIRVRATSKGGASGPSNEAVVLVGPPLPGPPSGLTASSSGTSLVLSWTAPNTGSAPTSYIVEAGSATGLSDLAKLNTGTNATSYVASGIANGQVLCPRARCQRRGDRRPLQRGVRPGGPAGAGPAERTDVGFGRFDDLPVLERTRHGRPAVVLCRRGGIGLGPLGPLEHPDRERLDAVLDERGAGQDVFRADPSQ